VQRAAQSCTLCSVQGGPKSGPQTQVHNAVKSEPILKKFTEKFLGKFVVKWIIKLPPHLAYVATLPCETLMSAINDKLQGSVATYLRWDGVVNNQIKKKLLASFRVNFFKLVNIWQSYKQQRGCLMHFAHLANALLKDEESARDNHVLVCNFAKYLPI